VSGDAKRVFFYIVGFLLLLAMCDSGGSGNPYDYPDNCYQGPFGYEC